MSGVCGPAAAEVVYITKDERDKLRDFCAKALPILEKIARTALTHPVGNSSCLSA